MTTRVILERRWLAEHPGQDFDESWHVKSEQVAYAVEVWEDILDELRPILLEHWKEMSRTTANFEPNYPIYATMGEAGMLHVVTARADDDLIGYYVGIVRPHHHAQSIMTAFTDFIFLKREWRIGMIGYNLVKKARDTLKARGVQQIYIGSKLFPNLAPILTRLGFVEEERLYVQVFI